MTASWRAAAVVGVLAASALGCSGSDEPVGHVRPSKASSSLSEICDDKPSNGATALSDAVMVPALSCVSDGKEPVDKTEPDSLAVYSVPAIRAVIGRLHPRVVSAVFIRDTMCGLPNDDPDVTSVEPKGCGPLSG